MTAGPTKDAATTARQQVHRDDLENLLETTKPRSWWAAAFVTVVIVAVGVWSFVANVPQTASAVGVLNALVYSYDIPAPSAGTVVFEGVSNGAVTNGATIATITATDGTQTKVTAPMPGRIRSVEVAERSFEEAGETLLSIAIVPESNEPVKIITFVGASELSKFSNGASVDITAVDETTGRRIVATAEIVGIGPVPSPLDSLNAANGGITELTNDWATASSGLPYPVFLSSTDWPAGKNGFQPFGGTVVEISRTYDTIHPIERLFGG